MCIQMETSPNYLEDNFFKKYIVNFTIYITNRIIGSHLLMAFMLYFCQILI